MFVNFKIILLSLFVVSVLTSERNKQKNIEIESGIQVKFNRIVKRAIDENKDEKSENTSENNSDDKDVPKEGFTDVPIDVTTGVPKEDNVNEVPKEETKNEEMDVRKEGEKIEREGEDEERPVSSQTPKEVEQTTPHTTTPLPPITRPTLPSVPTETMPTRPTGRPLFPFQPTYPSSNWPNYWQNPNWGNWGRFVPQNTNTWSQQWPAFNGWPSVPSVSQIPNYSPSNIFPSRYSPGGSFGMTPGSGIPTFSFLVPNNPYPGGSGFQYPGSQPSVPTYSGFQPGYQPRFIPSQGPGSGYYPGYQPGGGGQTPGFQPGIGGQTPRYYPGVGGQTPGYHPGTGGQTPGYHPGAGGQTPGYHPGAGGQTPRFHPGGGGGGQGPPQPQPGADPNRPMGPMGPEFNDPDVTMIEPDLMSGNGGRRQFPGKVVVQGFRSERT